MFKFFLYTQNSGFCFFQISLDHFTRLSAKIAILCLARLENQNQFTLLCIGPHLNCMEFYRIVSTCQHQYFHAIDCCEEVTLFSRRTPIPPTMDCDQSSIQRIETVFTEISFDGTVFTVSYSSTKGPIIHGISHRYSRKRKLNQFILSGGTFTGASGSAIILVDAFAFDLCAKAISATHHCSNFRSAELRFLGLWTVLHLPKLP